jgi:preprotein translocase subunit SecG
MKSAVFCIICLMIAFVVSNNADKQIQHDTQKMMHQSYTM